jgi:DNA polymerase elongation subunit (family B)
MERVFRLFDFNIYSKNPKTYGDGDDDDSVGEVSTFVVQMFGLDEQGKSACILVENFKPFFYVMVDDSWTISKKNAFLAFIQAKMGKFHENTITDCKIIKRHKLYGFDGGKEHLFVRLEFENIEAFNKAKGLWYGPYLPVDSTGRSDRKLLPNGLQFQNSNTRIYESNIPPLLRFFHLKDISPSGWVALPNKRTIEIKHMERKTNCDYEFIINYEHIIPLNQKETRVPYKICSFDIEASSSHGDFPIPIKSYKKLATNIVEYFEKLVMEITPELCKNLLKQIVLTAFGYASIEGVDVVYPKTRPKDKSAVDALIEKWLVLQVKNMQKDGDFMDSNTIEALFAKQHESEKDGTLGDSEGVDATADQSTVIDNGPTYNATKVVMPKSYTKKTATIVDIMCDKKFDRDGKLNELNVSLNTIFPKLEGDKVTFIGSTFLKYGSPGPYLNNCIVLNTCTNPNAQDDSNTNTTTEIESYSTERDVLLAWQKLIQKENPDIIIGYNIFGFDYQFMFYRAKENDCLEDFLKLSRNVDEICAQKDRETLQYKLEESSIKIASGQHDLRFIKMTGRLQVDLYNFFRREENLTSYKLDYVAGHFIGDYCKTVDFDASTKTTTISTTNMMGLQVGSFVHFEEIGHTVEYYQEGAKFLVTAIHAKDKKFELKGVHIQPDTSKKTRWCLAKDDCTPKDIFRLANGSADDRAVIAKYCIQDCNLVHYLMNKVDILTGFIEMAKICSVPMNFLVMRGQGIKLQSFIAKKCREFRTLIPVIEKGDNSEGYEGAIVLPPKCDLYLDNPVACVDYASLYPSSIISENLSHDSKVWTKEYDLAGNFVKATGETDKEGNFLYDNLPGYEYVDISFDLYRYIRTSPSAAAQKVRCGKKMCRFAQFPNGKRAIMPTILQELLAARKSTRKLIPQQTDEFMKNVLDKRQLGYKLTANSLYGGCGAVTSTFYEQDVAASTTATGRMLLTYAKRIIEECYGDAICDTSNYGPICTKAEYIYGDSVANYTPVYVRVDGKIDVCTIEYLAEKYGEGETKWKKCLDEGKQEKEVCEMPLGVETWTDKGWTKLYRVIRHELAPEKKMIRVLTHIGLVDVTDDHSLIKLNGEEISPKEVNIGMELLHNKLPVQTKNNSTITVEEAQVMGFFFGDGSCGVYDCPSGKKSSWALNNASMEIIEEYLELCKIAYPELDWVVLPTLESSGVYKISPKSLGYGSQRIFIENYREKMYFEKSKIIPQEIINGTKELKEAFWKGMYDADGDKDANGYTRIDQKNQISSACICLLAASLGWNTSINTRIDKPNIYRTTMTRSKQRRNPNAVKKICEIPYTGYVYDLTTENHHFAAGVGNMIVHNTDSVFFTFNLQTLQGEPIRGKKALEITIELAQEAGHLASSFLKQPHDLEYEKTFMPFCLLSKKRYVGMLYETDPNKCKRKEMGIVLKRRDNAPIVKDIYGGIIDILMKEQNVQKAVEFLKACLQNMVDEKYPMEKLIITKSLRSGYKNPMQIAHKVLADRMTARDPGNKPGSGDRIPFVYIHNTNKNALQGEKIETPSFIMENSLKIDYSFYITNQIMKPVQQVFALVLEKIWLMQEKKAGAPKLKFKMDVNKLKEKWEDPEKFEAKLEELKHKHVKALLFDEYLRVTNNQKVGNQALTSFWGKKT